MEMRVVLDQVGRGVSYRLDLDVYARRVFSDRAQGKGRCAGRDREGWSTCASHADRLDLTLQTQSSGQLVGARGRGCEAILELPPLPGGSYRLDLILSSKHGRDADRHFV